MTTQLKDKIIPSLSIRTSEDAKNRFAIADTIFETDTKEVFPKLQKPVIRKSVSFPEETLVSIDTIKDRALNKKIILSDSEVVRLGVQMVFELQEEELYKKAGDIKRISSGRPKKH